MSESIHAYKISSINKIPTLNVVDDEWLVDNLGDQYLDSEGCGIMVVEKTRIEELLQFLELGIDGMFDEDKEHNIKILKKMLKNYKNKDKNIYLCF